MATITSLGFSIFARDMASRTFRRVGDAAQEVASRAQRMSDTMVDTGRDLTTKVTLPLAGVGGTALKMSGDFESSMNRVKAVSGATGSEFTQLSDLARDLGSTTQYSASEAAQGMSFLAMAGFETTQILDALPGVLNLAAAGQLELAEAADIASNILSGYGFEASEVNKVNDILAKTFTSANVDMRMLGESFKYVAPVASSAGIQFEEAAASIGLLGNAGIQGSEAGTALRGAIARLLQPTAAVSDTLARLGVNVTDSRGELLPLVDIIGQLEKSGAKTADMMTIFGVEAGPAMQALVSQGSGSLADLTKELENSGGTAQQIADTQMEGLNGSLKSLQSAFEGLMLAIGDSGLLDVATRFVERLTEMTQSASKADSGLLRIGVVVGGVVAAIGPLLWTLGSAIKGFQKVAAGAAIVSNGFTTAVGPIGRFVTGIRNVNAAMAANATFATRLGAALRSQVMLWRQQAAAANVSTARIILNAAAQKIVAAATRVWAVAQRVLNAALRANPIGLIITAIMLLVGAFVIAYKRSETFRAIVDKAWAGIKNAVSAAWEFIRPVFEKLAGFVTGTIVPALGWLGRQAGMVFGVIWGAIQTAWALIRPVFDMIATVIKTVVGISFTVLLNIVKVVWIAIQLQIKIAWAVIKGIFNAIRIVINTVLAPTFRWLWSNVIKPVWDIIVNHIKARWADIKALFDVIRRVLSAILGPAFTNFRALVKSVWDGTKNIISRAWNDFIRPVFDKLREGVSKVRQGFSTGVDAIGKTWDKLRDLTRKPVNFVIGLYNDGIVNLVNRVAKFAGIDTRLNKIKKFRDGGVLPGYTPGRDPHKFYSPTGGALEMSGGEAIMRPEFTRGIGAGTIHYLNKLARTGGPRAIRDWLSGGGDRLGAEGAAFSRGGVASFKLGGIVGGFMKKIKDFAFTSPEKAFKDVLEKIGGGLPGSGVFRDAVAAVPKKLISSLVTWFKEKVGFGGGPGMKKALAFAQAQAGKPYSWGGVGPGGYDCSGFMSAIHNVIEGKNPYSRRYTTFSFTGANRGPGGFVRNRRSGFEVGVTNAGVGHMSGTLLGKGVESRGSAGVVVGNAARGAGDPLYTMRYGLRADTGAATLAPGWNPVYNGTGKPEYLETPRRGHDGPLVNIEKVEVHDRADVDLLADQLGFRMRAQAL